MPVLDIDGQYATSEEFKEKRVFRTQEELKTSTIFHKEVPLNSLVRYIKGNKWTIDYFSQIRDVNDSLVELDPNIPVSAQKYNRINKLILHVQSPISQDKIESIEGEAIINAGFLPNAHDVFIATLTGGREALFTITSVENRTYNLHLAYYVNFKLHLFLDDQPLYYNNLLKKVIREYTYDKEHLLDYSAPVILTSDYKKKLNLKDAIPDLIDHYFTHFVNHDKNVIALPTKASIYVDTMLTDFIFKIVNRTDHEIMSKLNMLDVDTKNAGNPEDVIRFSIWDVIIERNRELLKKAVRNIGFKYEPYNSSKLITRRMNFLGINFIARKLGNGDTATMPPTIDLSIPTEAPITPPVLEDDRSYVLSNAFYDGNGQFGGLLEQLLNDYLDSKILDAEKVQVLLHEYPHWSTYDQFYLIPLLMVLIKDSVSNTFKPL